MYLEEMVQRLALELAEERERRQLLEKRVFVLEAGGEAMTMEKFREVTGLSRSGGYQAVKRFTHYKQGKRVYVNSAEVYDWLTSERLAGRGEIKQAAQHYMRTGTWG